MSNQYIEFKRVSYIRSLPGTQLIPSHLALNTSYNTNNEIEVEHFKGVKWFSVETSLEKKFLWVEQRDSKCGRSFPLWMEGEAVTKYKGEITEEHIKKCKELEQMLGNNVKVVEYVPEPFGESYITSITQNQGKESQISLETKLRAPTYWLPDGFVIDNEQLFDVDIVSRAVMTKDGPVRDSKILRPNGTVIELFSTQLDTQTQLPYIHEKSLKTFIEEVSRHYSKFDSQSHLGFLEDSPEVMSFVDFVHRQNESDNSLKEIK